MKPSRLPFWALLSLLFAAPSAHAIGVADVMNASCNLDSVLPSFFSTWTNRAECIGHARNLLKSYATSADVIRTATQDESLSFKIRREFALTQIDRMRKSFDEQVKREAGVLASFPEMAAEIKRVDTLLAAARAAADGYYFSTTLRRLMTDARQEIGKIQGAVQ